MRNFHLLTLVAVALLAVACDPYDDVKGGTPNVVGVGAANTLDGMDAVEGTAAAAGWTVAGATCGGVTDADDNVVNAGAFDQSYFYITLDRQIDGALVQTSVTDCTPVAGTLTIDPAPAAGNSWYTCYSPASPSPDQGGSIVVYQAAAGGSDGWHDFEYLPAATYTIVGTVAGQSINVTVTPDAVSCAP
jgi:hypothetical protein